MIKILCAIVLSVVLYTSSIVIAVLLTKEKINAIYFGDLEAKKIFSFKIFNIDLIFTQSFILNTYVETHSNVVTSAKKYFIQTMLTVIIAFALLYLCVFSNVVFDNIQNNKSQSLIKQTNVCIINSAKFCYEATRKLITTSVKKEANFQKPIKKKSIEFFDIFIFSTIVLIFANFIGNLLFRFLPENLIIVIIACVVVFILFNDIQAFFAKRF